MRTSIKTKTTTRYDIATLNKKGMVPKDKGWGMTNLGYGEKTHVSPPLLICHLFVSPNLVNLFNAPAGGWGVMAEWLRAFIAGEKRG